MEKSVCFLEHAVFVVEVLAWDHNRPEVKEAKAKEKQNLEDYETFKVVEDIGEERIGSCWVITSKEKDDGQIKRFQSKTCGERISEGGEAIVGLTNSSKGESQVINIIGYKLWL